MVNSVVNMINNKLGVTSNQHSGYPLQQSALLANKQGDRVPCPVGKEWEDGELINYPLIDNQTQVKELMGSV